MTTPQPDGTLLALITLLELQRRALGCRDKAEFFFFAVNELHLLTPYRQGVLWHDGRIVAVSGLPTPNGNAPFVHWLEKVLSPTPLVAVGEENRLLGMGDLPEPWREQWSEFLPEYGLWLPLPGRNGELLAGILLARDFPWQGGDRQLLAALTRVLAMVWEMLHCRRHPWQEWWQRHRRYSPAWLLLAVLAALWIPVPLSVLAPAEIIAAAPAIVRSPLDGVINDFLVQPNQVVTSGQTLFVLDDTTLRGRLSVAQKERDVFLAQYRQGAQKALRDEQATARQEIFRERWQQHQSEVEFLESQLQRVTVKSPRGGIAIFSDPYDWIGRPVKLGERVITLADPDRVEVEIRLAVADAVTLTAGVPVTLFLDQDPSRPLLATLRYIGYQAEVTAAGVAVYTLRATLTPPAPPVRIGLQGTARLVYGQGPLYHYLLRRPLTALRQWLGY